MRMPKKEGLNVIPLIDIMLVLLAIVLSISTFIAQGKIPIDLPSAESAQQDNEDKKKISVVIDKDNNFFIDDTQINPDELKTKLNEIDAKTLVELRSDKDSKFDSFVRVIDILKEKMQKLPKYIWYLVSFVIVGIVCIISMVAGLDYEYHAIMIGYLFYIFYNKRVFAIFLGYLAIFKEFWSLSGFGLILTYNGKRGKQSKVLNYCFYPVHLLILGILRMVLKI